jgi:RHS repeat-associated protein
VIIQETTNGATTSYVYGLDLLSMTDDSDVTRYFLQDGLGSTTGLADETGTVIGTFDYDVFGALRGQTGDVDTDWRFTGELQDSTVGQAPYYLRARYYDAGIGRFLGKDPMPVNPMNPQTANPYIYGLNNPGRYVDPLGLSNAEGGSFCGLSSWGFRWFGGPGRFACDVAEPTSTPVPGPSCPTGWTPAPQPIPTPCSGGVCPPGGGGGMECRPNGQTHFTQAFKNAVCSILPWGPIVCAAGPQAVQEAQQAFNWLTSTCEGQITGTVLGAGLAVTGLGAIYEGYTWGGAVFTAGAGVLQMSNAGPPGSALSACRS